MFRTPSAFTPILRLSRAIHPIQHQFHQTKSFTTTRAAMGFTKEILAEGDKENFPQEGDKVTMHYVGTLEDGKKFDSSRDRGTPFGTIIGRGKVIRGWDEGVPTMSLGEIAVLNITGDYGYAEKGFPGLIPPNSTLIFEIELLSINDKKKPT
ncbi:macrolide-binding protein FKBP12 [Tricharina praecox]|uniref:macrolide-binding protein FKBP12 n=1 Tax=Tricharina praecox TaxID=43433 RepID=UPI00221E79B4|nr:macrolide-binding protein FKBP12 [Tricharina praecox]KAI5854244.1 macrolide-binding protein FKBP12 [Tricharina praecox]